MSPKVFCLTFGAHFSVSYLLSDIETFFWCLLIYLFSYLFCTIYHLQRSEHPLYLHIAIGAMDNAGWDFFIPIITELDFFPLHYGALE